MEKRGNLTSDTEQEGGSRYGSIGWGAPKMPSAGAIQTSSHRIVGDAWKTLSDALYSGDKSSRILAEFVIYAMVHDEVINGLFHPQTGVICKFADQADRTIEKAIASLETGLR